MYVFYTYIGFLCTFLDLEEMLMKTLFIIIYFTYNLCDIFPNNDSNTNSW